MTAQRTDEEESTAPVGQENPGGDVAEDSTDLTIDADAASLTSDASATAETSSYGSGDDADPATVDGMIATATSGQGEAAGASELGDAASLQDRAAAAVDSASDGETMTAAFDTPEATGVAEAATDGETVEATDDATATATDEATATATDEATAPDEATATATDEATAPDEATATLDATATDEVTAMASPDATAQAATDDVSEAPAADAIAEAPTADDTADAPAADEVGEVAVDELDAAPAAEEEPAPAPYVETRPEPTTMEELLNEQSGDIRSFKHGDVVEGNVVRIDKDEILVDIGAKSEGVVSNRELYGRHGEAQPVLNIGDVVLVYVLQPESNEGHAVLSLRRAGLERKWRSMQEQFDAGVIIEAPVIDHNKGGLIVDCGIRGFVPISQIVDFPRRPQNEQPRDAAQEIAEKLQPFVGRKLRLKILEVNRKANRLILSEKVALYEERREKRDELFSSLQVGQKVTGSVRSIAPFGVFVDLGGIDGLVHKSELSWNKVNNPEHGYKVGEEVEAEVIDINHERGRISLSIRRLQPDPWHSTVADLKVNDLIDGTVTKIVNFGAFVRVRDGLEGLIHISELSHQRVAHPGDVVHEGQRLKLKIISLDSERHRLGLSLKQAEEAPARPASEPRADRPRQRSERSFDASQAVQEPEGGIDNTLAAAFAAVRQQVAQAERAQTADEAPESDETTASADATDESEAAPAAELNGTTIDTEANADDETGTAEAVAADEATATAEAGTAEPATDEAAVAEPATDEAGTAEASATDLTADDEAVAADATADEATATAEAGTAEPATDEADEATATDEAGTADPATTDEPAPDEAGAAEAVADDAEVLDQGSADEAAPTVDETGIAAGATEYEGVGDDSSSGGEPADREV